jgi:hypothetical protein
VAVVLAAMIAVLLLAWTSLHKSTVADTPPFDLSNPLLTAEAGECIEVEDQSQPGVVERVVVIAPGEGAARGRGAAVIRPSEGPASIPGVVDAHDLRRTAPYLACEVLPTGETPAGSPARSRDVLLFDLNAFGFPRGSRPSYVLREVRPALVRWGGKPQRCHQVTVSRHDRLEGNWLLYLTGDAPALGTVLRKYFSAHMGLIQQSFLPCR